MTRRFSVLVLSALLGTLLLVHTSIGAQPNVGVLGPAVGERVPDFAGRDQFGHAQTSQSVMGSEGAMLVFFRSADW